jgi:hypothetical protein
VVVRERRSGVVVRERRIGVGGSGGLRALTVGTAGVEGVRRSVFFGDPKLRRHRKYIYILSHLPFLAEICCTAVPCPAWVLTRLKYPDQIHNKE